MSHTEISLSEPQTNVLSNQHANKSSKDSETKNIPMPHVPQCKTNTSSSDDDDYDELYPIESVTSKPSKIDKTSTNCNSSILRPKRLNFKRIHHKENVNIKYFLFSPSNFLSLEIHFDQHPRTLIFSQFRRKHLHISFQIHVFFFVIQTFSSCETLPIKKCQIWLHSSLIFESSHVRSFSSTANLPKTTNPKLIFCHG